jgi:hypothetical protein
MRLNGDLVGVPPLDLIRLATAACVFDYHRLSGPEVT